MVQKWRGFEFLPAGKKRKQIREKKRHGPPMGRMRATALLRPAGPLAGRPAPVRWLGPKRFAGKNTRRNIGDRSLVASFPCPDRERAGTSRGGQGARLETGRRRGRVRGGVPWPWEEEPEAGAWLASSSARALTGAHGEAPASCGRGLGGQPRTAARPCCPAAPVEVV